MNVSTRLHRVGTEWGVALSGSQYFLGSCGEMDDIVVEGEGVAPAHACIYWDKRKRSWVLRPNGVKKTGGTFLEYPRGGKVLLCEPGEKYSVRRGCTIHLGKIPKKRALCFSASFKMVMRASLAGAS